jgi:hypothetical protein
MDQDSSNPSTQRDRDEAERDQSSSHHDTTVAPVQLFYSYCHSDEAYRRTLETHLALLKRRRIIESWNDRDIQASEEWRVEISQHLDGAKIILLLISADFLASDYCYDIEMQRAMQRHNAGEASVIPIILRACDWDKAPFSKLQALPTDAKPVNSWADRDEAFTIIARRIRELIERRYLPHA